MGYTVALTGGIGSGKSTVADAFAQLGVKVIDADVIARQVVEPGTPALRGHCRPLWTTDDCPRRHAEPPPAAGKNFAHVEEKSPAQCAVAPADSAGNAPPDAGRHLPLSPLGRTFAGRKPPVRPVPIAYWSSMCRKRRKSNAPCCAIRSAANMLNIFLPPEATRQQRPGRRGRCY